MILEAKIPITWLFYAGMPISHYPVNAIYDENMRNH